jgi:hypothetical protein
LFGAGKVNKHGLEATFVELAGKAAIKLPNGVAAEESGQHIQLNLPPIKIRVSPMTDLRAGVQGLVIWRAIIGSTP